MSSRLVQNNDVSIRLASDAEDIALVRSLLEEYQAEIGFDLCFQNFAVELAALPGAYSPPRGRLFLAQVDNEVAGCVSLRELDDSTCEMKRLFVRPPFRVAGIGRTLVEHCLQAAREIGYRRMVLDTLPNMVSAHRLYESLGFVPIEAYTPNPIVGAKYLALVL